MIFLLFMPLLTAVLFVPNLPAPFLNGFDFHLLVGGLAMLFCVAASTGYILSFLTAQRRHGRAYECTSFFFCNLVGMSLFAWGYFAMPDPPQGILPALPGASACVLGLWLLVSLVLAEGTREERQRATVIDKQQ